MKTTRYTVATCTDCGAVYPTGRAVHEDWTCPNCGGDLQAERHGYGWLQAQLEDCQVTRGELAAILAA